VLIYYPFVYESKKPHLFKQIDFKEYSIKIIKRLIYNIFNTNSI